LYNILIEFDITLINLVILIKMCSNYTCSKFHIGTTLYDNV
jgi:hypothetical protein